MNEALRICSLQHTGFRRETNKIRNVGAYLKAVPAGSHTARLSIIIDTLKTIVQVL